MSLIERDLSIRAIAEDIHDLVMTERPDCNDTVESWIPIAADILSGVPDAEPEITDEQAILHLQSTGWMQNHDKAMYESGLREQLADDSGSYDSLIQTQPEIIYCKDCKLFGEPKCLMCFDGYDWAEPDGYCHMAERRKRWAD